MKVLVEEHFLENYTPTLDSIQINKDLIFHKVGLYGKLVGRSKNMLLEFTNQPTSSGRVLWKSPLDLNTEETSERSQPVPAQTHRLTT